MPWKKKNDVQAPHVRSWQIMVVVPVFLYHGWMIEAGCPDLSMRW